MVSLKLCGRLPGIPLNTEGRQQSQAVARQLGDLMKLHAVYSSPLQRAAETAAAVAAARDLTVTLDERLTEMEFGEWTGLSFQELASRDDWHRYNRNRSLNAAPGGESLMQVQARAWGSLAEITARHDGETVAVVTHADVIRALVVLFLGMSLDQLLRLEIAPASITEVILGADYPVVTGLNKVLIY
ncbi:MAG: Phosphoglycerate mutase [Bryobacterales bacterium]|jgi:broad specificity phosphatase PhoE|nr:Phosphoglycerate mutase [Bryobacterales bacterium]